MSETAPSPQPLPFVGHALSNARDPLGFSERAVEQHGGIVSLSSVGKDILLLADPPAIEHALVRNADNYRKGEFQRAELASLLGDGLLISEGDHWREQHDRIQPAFYPGRIREYTNTVVPRTEAALQWGDRDVVDIRNELSALTLNILGETLFDVDFREVPAVHEAAEAVTQRFTPRGHLPFHVPDWVPTPRNRRYLRAIDQLDDFVATLIKRCRTRGMNDDLLSILLQTWFPEEEVRDHLVTFLLAGHETTALALTYTLYLLAEHPSEQARVSDELASELDGPPTPDSKLPRTDRTIREAMRLFPPVHTVMREAVDADEIGGYAVESGTLVMCSQWVTHRRRSFYDDPESFYPERWTSWDGPDYAYFPFGGGPRACIGRRFALLEARLILASNLQRFQFESPPSTSVDPVAAMTLTPDGAVDLRVRKRETANNR